MADFLQQMDPFPWPPTIRVLLFWDQLPLHMCRLEDSEGDDHI